MQIDPLKALFLLAVIAFFGFTALAIVAEIRLRSGNAPQPPRASALRSVMPPPGATSPAGSFHADPELSRLARVRWLAAKVLRIVERAPADEFNEAISLALKVRETKNPGDLSGAAER